MRCRSYYVPMPLRIQTPENSITHERLCALVSYDKRTGEFTWLVRRKCHGGGITPGSPVIGYIDPYGYRIIGLDRKRYRASRLAWFYVHKVWPVGEVDHKDRDTLNNAMENLRDSGTTRALQRANQKVRKDSRSGIKGVNQLRDGKWRARLGGKTLGKNFKTAEDAHAAYMKAAKALFGAWARSS